LINKPDNLDWGLQFPFSGTRLWKRVFGYGIRNFGRSERRRRPRINADLHGSEWEEKARVLEWWRAYDVRRGLGEDPG